MRKWIWLLALGVAACGTTTVAADDAGPTDTGDVAASCIGAAGKPFVETAQPDTSRKKFALSLFHFNLEYVIGGLEYIDAKGVSHLFTSNPNNAGWSNDKVEDFIVRESFLPILQMYDKHPTWGVDLELQAYMIDVMAARHTDVLDLLRKLAQRGQVEIISFHYNDQLFLGFPREDLQRSIDATKATFAANCLPLSGVVFNQEGQAGEGRQKMLVDNGYSVGVYPKNLFYYVHHDVQNPWPYFSSEGGDLIVGGAGVDPASGIQVNWNFLDDGELRAAPEASGQALNPYFAPTASHDPARVAEFEQELADTEKQGFYMARIGDYVRHLKAENIEQKAVGALVDGTWQPGSTDSIHRWLGGRGLWGADENDFEVRKGNYEARTQVAAVQVLAEMAKGQGLVVPGLDNRTAKLWKDLWRAEVSDCSGVNPWLAEVQWALDHNPVIIADARQLGTDLKAAMGWKNAHVDPVSRTAVDQPPQGAPNWQTVDAPIDVTVTVDGRTFKATWLQIDKDKRWRLQIAFSPSDPTDDPFGREIGVTFPHNGDAIEYSPALLDDEVRKYAYAAFTFQTDHIWVPIPNGLIGLGLIGGKNWYVVKHARSENLAARIDVKKPIITFSDETVRLDLAPTWQFEVLQGPAKDALAVAKELNIAPTVDF